MRSAIWRVRQLLVQGIGNVLWLAYVLGIAPWVHRTAGPALHVLCRSWVRRRRNSNVAHRMELLRCRVANRPPHGRHVGVALAKLSPELEEICRPLRPWQREIPLADVDQDGFLLARHDRLWDAPRVDAHAFVPRARFELTVVDRGGLVGVRKNFRGDKVAFVNELEAALDLTAAGCHVPAILGVDFERLSITSAYINGAVVRESLAQAGAPLRDRDLKPSRFRLLDCILAYRSDTKRATVGRSLIDEVLDRDTIARVGKALLAIHRANYTLGDIKYGNIIIETETETPYFIDCEYAMPLRMFFHSTATYLRDRDAAALNRLFGTDLITAKTLRQSRRAADRATYAPFYLRSGIRWGAIWHPDFGIQRWRYMLAQHLPVPRGGRVLDVGANNGFNALQMLRAGAAEVVAVEIDPEAINEGLFVKRAFEWADNVEYRLSYIHGSYADVASMNLGRFDLITAFCTLYYVSRAAMANTVAALSNMTDTLVLQCNEEHWIERSDPETFAKASLRFNIDLVGANGFPHVTVIRRRGSNRPLVIARSRVGAEGERVFYEWRGRAPRQCTRWATWQPSCSDAAE